MGEKSKGFGLWLVVFGIIILFISMNLMQWDFWYNAEFWKFAVPVVLISWGAVYLFGK
ncbi:MAG: hypothetical protein AB1467_04180 [Candidatus Diapherotrites archaeon]